MTGGSKGLGKALAFKLASLGLSVTLIARNKEELSTNMKALPICDNEQRHDFLQYDLKNLIWQSNEDLAYKKLTDAVTDCTILVNCAGITTHKLFPRLEKQQLVDTISVNLTAPLILTQMCVKQMMKAAKRNPDISPSVLNFSSVLSLTEYQVSGTAAYAALKAGLLGFTKALAFELKGKVRVNLILPGLVVETEMGAQSSINETGLKISSLEETLTTALDLICDNHRNGQCIIVGSKN